MCIRDRFNGIDGKQINLADYENKVLVVVNVASRCGFTPQYSDLQKVWEDYKDKDVIIIGVPTNNFKQEPGSEEEIKEFCEKYQKTVNKNEPNTLAWGWFRTDKRKVALIERYRNEDAMLNHIKNVSKGGVMEKDIASLFEHFNVEKMIIHGDISKSSKSIISEFGIPTIYSSNISSYSR